MLSQGQLETENGIGRAPHLAELGEKVHRPIPTSGLPDYVPVINNSRSPRENQSHERGLFDMGFFMVASCYAPPVPGVKRTIADLYYKARSILNKADAPTFVHGQHNRAKEDAKYNEYCALRDRLMQDGYTVDEGSSGIKNDGSCYVTLWVLPKKN